MTIIQPSSFFEIPEHPPLPELVGANGPPLWTQILTRFPTAVLAGGAVRDYALGVKPKDIDLFLDTGSYSEVPYDFQAIVGDRRDEDSERAQAYLAMPNIDIVLRADWSGWQVDMVGIKLESVAELLSSFDFGIARCAFTLNDGVIDTPEARSDRENKTVTLLHHDRPERARARFDRFNERMGGGWRFVDA